MVKRSSSKRAYKKRRTVRKSRVIRRGKTARSKRKIKQRKTQRGGVIYGSSGPSYLNIAKYGAELAKSVGTSMLNGASAAGNEFLKKKTEQLKDKLSSFSAPTAAEIVALALGGFVATLINISKMISYIGTYIYIAKLMTSNPEYAKQMFEIKKQEIQAKNQELAECFEKAFSAISPTDTQAQPQVEPILPEKEESIIDEFIRRIGEFRQSESKSQFVKEIVNKFIQRKRAEIESLKDNPKTKGIYECLKAALNKVDKTKEEMGAEVEAAPIDDSKLDQAQEAAETQEAAPAQQTDEERKAALKAANIKANTDYDAAKQKRDEAKKNFGKGPNLDNAQAAASAAYELALNAARAAAAGGVENVIYP
jgi:hypothetical protein